MSVYKHVLYNELLYTLSYKVLLLPVILKSDNYFLQACGVFGGYFLCDQVCDCVRSNLLRRHRCCNVLLYLIHLKQVTQMT